MAVPVLYLSGQDTKIQDIREKFQSINRDKNYTVLTLNNEEFLEQMTEGGGQLTGYFKGDSIYKIHERIGLSYCVLTTEYYFRNEHLIFVFEKEDVFPYIDSLATFDYTRTENTFEGRYYFDKDTLIETKIKGEKLIPDELKYDSQTKEGDLLSSAKKNVDLLKKGKDQ
jgi:hypothetical protein